MNHLIPTFLSYSIRVALDISVPWDEMSVFSCSNLAQMRQLAIYRSLRSATFSA